MSARAIAISAAALVCASACIAPSVVDSAGRAVVSPTADLAWQPARREDLLGLFESIAIEGEAAASLWKIYYVFADSGAYSGAALVLGAHDPEFQTLSGTWTLAGEILDFGGGETARVSSTADHLKLENEGGVAILRRAAVQ